MPTENLTRLPPPPPPNTEAKTETDSQIINTTGAWKKAELTVKSEFANMNARISEINKGLHDNSKISELIVEIISLETVRKILSGKIRDFKGHECMINIHPGAAKTHWERLRPGNVLILRNVTVFSPSVYTHCLIVLKDNIVNILSS